MANEFEVIGYMKAIEGENDFSMFVNENIHGRTGGFEWNFKDYCPEVPHEHRRIFIHTLSIHELRMQIKHELEQQWLTV